MSDKFEKSYQKWHARWSYAKSALRILGCSAVIWGDASIVLLAAALLVAELIGVIEEWV